MTDTANAPERDNMPDTIMAWPDFDGCITGAWSANQYSDERAREYISRTHCDELVAAAYLDAGQRIEQCLWSQHWYIDGESVDPEDLSEDITSRTPDDARAALTARDERMKAEGANEAQANLNELQSDRPFIVGWNLGFAEAEYQQAHGKPSDGDLSPKYSFIFNEEEQRQFEAIRAALQENSNE